MKARPILLTVVLVPLLVSCALASGPTLEKRIARVERGLIREYGDPPAQRMSLADRMAAHNVPGVSMAVINDYQVEWAKGYGVVEAGSNEPVTPATLFQAASIAKPVVALAALHTVERGLLDLDSNVNQYLVSWHVPENEFTVQEEVTLRRLLSHSAGVTVHGFRGYAQGEPVPSLQQILDGQPPANSPPIRVSAVPGSGYAYSGGGYMIVQQLLEDVTGKPFPEIMRDAVLDPWGMASSTFEAPLPEELRATAASGHRADGAVIPGRWHTYPEMGAGGSMWSTPSDMARFAIGVMLAYNGRSDQALSHEMAVEMLTPQIGNHGLGLAVLDEGGDRFYFMHDGANDGYKTVLVAYPERGQGVVIMTNGDGGDALWREILNSVSVEYGLVRDNTWLVVGLSAVIVLALLAGLLLLNNRAKRVRG